MRDDISRFGRGASEHGAQRLRKQTRPSEVRTFAPPARGQLRVVQPASVQNAASPAARLAPEETLALALLRSGGAFVDAAEIGNLTLQHVMSLWRQHGGAARNASAVAAPPAAAAERAPPGAIISRAQADAMALLRSGRSYGEAAEASRLSINEVMQLWRDR